MQYSRYDNHTTHNNEQIHIKQSDHGIYKVIQFVVFVSFATVILKLSYNLRIQSAWYSPGTANTETFTLENNENVEQRENQNEGREETTL